MSIRRHKHLLCSSITCILFAVFICCFCIALQLVSVSSYSNWEDYDYSFEEIKSNPTALRIFMEKFPKGAELHNHLTGSTYTENVLQYSAKYPELCLETKTFTVYNSKNSTKNCTYPLYRVLNDQAMYTKLLLEWSLFDFHKAAPGFKQTKPSDLFFDTFLKYHALTEVCKADILAESLNRAARQKLSYIEIIIMVPNPTLADIAKNFKTGHIQTWKIKQKGLEWTKR